MISKCVAVFLLLQVLAVEFSSGRHMTSLHLDKNHISPKPSLLDLTKLGYKRGRRCLGTALSLLWPQVVGPVEKGIIEESSFDEVPKTLLEYRLEMLRKKAEEEEEGRLTVRNYLKRLTEAQDEFYGYQNSLITD